MTKAPQNKRSAVGMLLALKRVRRAWRRIYGPFDQASAQFLDHISENPRRRRIASIAVAIAINISVITVLGIFGRVQIPVSLFPTGSISITLVEMQTPDLPELRDPELTPEPEAETEPEIEDPETEVVEELEPEPEPEPEPVSEPEPPAAPEPEIEPEPTPEEPEPELVLDLDEPVFAPPGDAPEPLILDPAAGADDDNTQDQSEENVEEQAPDEEAPEPLISVEPEENQRPGLDEIIGEEDADSVEETGAEDNEGEEEEEDLEQTPLQNDDAFDIEPSLSTGRFSGRRFVRPQVQLPLGDTPITPGSSGVVAIFCPEEFIDDDKAKECAGRRELRSGWRPGDSGEDWSRATRLLKRDRERGRFGPTAGPVAQTIRRQREFERAEDLNDFRRNDPNIDNLPDTLDDNISAGVQGDRPNIGPREFVPGWARRNPNEPTEKEIEELRKALEEVEKDN